MMVKSILVLIPTFISFLLCPVCWCNAAIISSPVCRGIEARENLVHTNEYIQFTHCPHEDSVQYCSENLACGA